MPNYELVTKILNALQVADCWMDERPSTPDSEGYGIMKQVTPSIRAIGWHQIGNIWVDAITEAGHNFLVVTINEWLPKLPEHSMYSVHSQDLLG